MSRTSLHDSRLPDVEAADAALARGELRRQCWDGLMVLVTSATGAAVAGVATAYAAPFLGISVSPEAGILAATVATVAVHLKGASAMAAKAVAARLPASRRLMQDILDAVPQGTVAARRGGVWVLHEPGSPEPRVVSEREYARIRRETPKMVEIDPGPSGITVSFLARGVRDSVVWGRPAMEVHGRDGSRPVSTWYMGGEKVTREDVRQTREELGVAPPTP